MQGNTEAGFKDIDRAIRLSPKNAEYLFNRGLAYARSKRNIEALNDLNLSIQINSKDASAYGVRGLVFFALRKYDKALKDFDKAITLDPSREKYYRGLSSQVLSVMIEEYQKNHP